jgi:hypothetical protein
MEQDDARCKKYLRYDYLLNFRDMAAKIYLFRGNSSIIFIFHGNVMY